MYESSSEGYSTCSQVYHARGISRNKRETSIESYLQTYQKKIKKSNPEASLSRLATLFARYSVGQKYLGTPPKKKKNNCILAIIKGGKKHVTRFPQNIPKRLRSPLFFFTHSPTMPYEVLLRAGSRALTAWGFAQPGKRKKVGGRGITS